MRGTFIALLLALAGCAPDAASPAPAALSPLRAVSLNIACGAGWTGPADRAYQNTFLASLAPDVVGMQEVDVGVARSGGGNTAAQSTSTMPGSVFVGRCAPVNGQGVLTAGAPGAVGVALWVRAGLVVVDSWTVPLDYADQAHGGDGWPRCAVLAHIVGEGHDFTAGVTHLVVGDNAYVRERRRLEVQETAAYGVDVLLLDANALGDELAEDMPAPMSLCSNPDFPGCVDQAWARGPCTGRLVPTHNASDHPYAAVAELVLP